MVSLLMGLLNKVSVMLVIAFVFSNTRIFSKLMEEREFTLLEKVLMSLFFGGIGIVGTYSGIPYMGAIVNNRIIGVAVGGLIGGPLVGTLSGLIAGGHRFLMDMDGFTSLSCGISTFVEGVLAGLLAGYFSRSRKKLLFAFGAGVATETVQMLLILLVARPFDKALELVGKISVPMILVNSIGITIFIAIMENIKAKSESQAASVAQKSLLIANETMPHLKKGLGFEAAENVAEIIKQMVEIDAVAITDTEKILAHVGLANEHHLPGSGLRTGITRAVLETGEHIVAYSPKEINCDYGDCELGSAVIVPLTVQGLTEGTLKLYRSRKKKMRKVDIELALGLGSLFSSQLELGKLHEQERMLKVSELKTLQSQVNPHFLFNALNSINALIRINGEEARHQLVNLSNYFRYNLSSAQDNIPLSRELEQVKSYVEIEKMRFSDNLSVKYSLEASPDILIPPLIIAPIVENSIKHGIFSYRESGNVHISTRTTDSHLEIKIMDDGVGMETGRIEEILEGRDESGSIGLINTHKRLKAYYGTDYGLVITSEKGKGTTVLMNIPLEVNS